MIREDTNKNIIERFPSMVSDLKLHAIPQLNKNKEDIWTAIKILAFYAVLGVYAYYKYMEMTGEVHRSPSVTRYTLMLLGAVPVGIVIALVVLYDSIRDYLRNRPSRKKIKKIRENYLEDVSKQIISYREAALEWMNKRFVPAENLIRRIMRGEKKIRNQGDVMLTYRLGTGDLDISEHILLPNMVNTPQNIKLKRTCKKLKEEYKVIHDIPKAISLDEVGLLGVVGQGDKRKAYDIVRALSTQILVSEVPEDLKVAFVYDSVHSKGWNKYESFTRTQMETGISLVAGTPEKRGKVLDMLAQTIEERKALNGDCVENMKPRYIVFIDDMALLENHRIAEALRDDLCVCAFTFIFVADCIEKLPENVEYALVDSSEFSGVYSMADHTCMPIVFDKLSEQKLDKYINYIKSKKTLRGGDLCWKK